MGRLKDDYPIICKGMGFKNACKLVLFPRLCEKLGIRRYNINNAIDKFIKTNFEDIVVKYKDVYSLKCDLEMPNVIWVFWWQGKSSMPQVIKQCYLSIQRNANGRRVIFLDKDNIYEYVTLPEVISNKFQKGVISFTHFSDIIRVELLRKYGGLWIDAAIFVTKPIPHYEGYFFSPRLSLALQDSPHMGQWVMGVMGTTPAMALFNYMHDMLDAYWKKYDVVFHYLMFDYFIRYGYEHLHWVKVLMDNRAIESPNLHSTRYTFNQEVDNERLDDLLKNNTFLSLTYRIPYPRKTNNGKDTYYSALLKKYDYNEKYKQIGGG